MELELNIDGVITGLDVAANETLLSLLRREGYQSVKQGCETGECGACTVLVDGVPRPSCVMLAGQAGGCSITTIKGLNVPHRLLPLQQAFVDVGAVQCGFCTDGMLLAATALLKRNPHPTAEEVRVALSGNICRCTGYAKPVEAVLRAAAVLRGEAVPAVEHAIQQSDGLSGSIEKLGHGSTTKIPLSAISNAAAGIAETLPGAQLQVVGKALPVLETTKYVTGRAAFTGDEVPRGTLYARILTSPHAHAVIRAIDTSQARALPGVHVVLTYKDVPHVPYTGVERLGGQGAVADQYSLDYIVRYAGDRVAVVAAETPEIAEQALALIEVEYDVLPPILEPRLAIETNAPPLHPEEESYGVYDAAHNIAARIRNEVGDVEQGFAEADLVVEGEYILSPTQQVSLETHTVITYFNENDHLVVKTNSAVPHHVRRTLATILNIPSRNIRVLRPSTGVLAGAHQEVMGEDLCALITVATNRPVMLSLTRAEAFRVGRIQPVQIVRLKTGVKRDGTLVANQLAFLSSTGAYATHPLVGRQNGVSEALSLYPCPHMRYVGEIVYTTHAPVTATRTACLQQEFFALESHMDEVAKQVGLEALAFRRKNSLKAGNPYPWLSGSERGKETVPVVESCGLEECLRTVEQQLHWHERRNTMSNGRYRRGVGAALALYGLTAGSVNTSSAVIRLNEDGAFDLFVGASGFNESGFATYYGQIVAEVLGVGVEDILVHINDTEMAPFDAGSERATLFYASCGAVKRAAEQVRRQVLNAAGRLFNVIPETLKVQRGMISAANGQTITMQQVGEHTLYVENRQIMTSASWRIPYLPASFAAQGAEVEVDTETGFVRVVKLVTAVDAGRVLNPLIAEGHVQGAVAQALGVSMSEELLYDGGGVMQTNSLDLYGIYHASDMPVCETSFVETIEPAGPFGAKSIGEVPLYGVAPAIANAIMDAIGVRVRQLPITPERILRAIHAQAQTAAKR